MASIQNGNINLIDPNDAISALNNGIPATEDLFIFAELTAERRSRSVIVGSGLNTIVQQDFSNTRTNFLGFDAASRTFTTRWTNELNGDVQTSNETFGIESIEVNISSSQIPLINITFVDVRGNSLYDKGENSPYASLIDFPPPLFKLTLKGYYGKSLTYELHLTKIYSSLSSDEGNFRINAEFVGRTFAPLTDILFNYVRTFPLINQNTSNLLDPALLNTQNDPSTLNSNISGRPRNTYELILKARSLYDNIKELKDSSQESEDYRTALSDLNRIDALVSRLNAFSNELSTTFQSGSGIFIKELDTSNGDKNGNIRRIPLVTAYNTVLSANATSGFVINNDNKLYLGVLIEQIREGNTPTSQDTIQQRKTLVQRELNTLRNVLLEQGSKLTTSVINSDSSGDIQLIENVVFDTNLRNSTSTNDQDIYTVLDITNFYSKIYKFRAKKFEDVNDSKNALVTIINDTVYQDLGMEPTIYNVMKIICDDIDTTFNILRQTSVEAENHHNEFSSIISPVIPDSFISAFPMYIETEDYTGQLLQENIRFDNNGNVISANNPCTVLKEVKRYPIALSNRLNTPFPEVRLVEDFIRASLEIQKLEETFNLKKQTDDNNNNKWIPISPIDSVLSNNVNYQSPYTAIQQNPNNVYSNILKRFYIQSQFAYPLSFYKQDGGNFFGYGKSAIKFKRLISYLAGAEAVNISNSLSDRNTVNSLLDKAQTFKNNPDLFYQTMLAENITNFTQIPDPLLLNDNTNIEFSKTNPDYNGFNVVDSTPSLRVISSSEVDNPVDKYIDSLAREFFLGAVKIQYRETKNQSEQFTVENVPFFKDEDVNDLYETFYLNNTLIFSVDGAANANKGSFVDIWSSYLAEIDLRFVEIFTDETIDDKVKAFLLLSTFGSARTLFSNNGNVNDYFFFPGIVEVPSFSIPFMGAMVSYSQDAIMKLKVNSILQELFDTYGTTALVAVNLGLNFLSYIGPDLIEENGFDTMSSFDQNLFLDEFERFLNDTTQYSQIVQTLLDMVDEVQNQISSSQIDDSYSDKYDAYKTLLQGEYKGAFSDKLNERKYIANYSQLTFEPDISSPTVNTPLSVSNTNADYKVINDFYFQEFWKTLSVNLKRRNEELEEVEINFLTSIQDNDIKTALYYSFKDLYDKWIAGLGSNVQGFPLNNDGRPLIDKFKFVDKGFNDIGNRCIINFESLITASEDVNRNMFSVISELLSNNGFEFFPLQNFMSFQESEWEESFKPSTTNIQQNSPAFVCMYIGGYSSMLDIPGSDYDDDGILDLGSTDALDFKNNCNPVQEFGVNRPENNISKVRAFRVRAGQQNQSIFKNFNFDSREHVDTNESLNLLSKIAKDESISSPIPKGQSMFNLYSQRSYTAKVLSMGNMMIQPTQYFQMENVSIFNGAYIILDVKHTVADNTAETSFSGVRVSRYPLPFITNFATSVGIQSGTAEDLTATEPFVDPFFSDNPTGVLPEQAQHNSMFDLRS